MWVSKKIKIKTPKLARPIPKAIVASIGLIAISEMPPAMHKPVSKIANIRIIKYVNTKKLNAKIALVAWVLYSLES